MNQKCLYTIGIPSPQQDVNAVCVCSETPLNNQECMKAYEDYWKARQKQPSKDVVVEQMGALA